MSELANLFLGKALEDIDAEGDIELNGPGKVRAKNILEEKILKDKNLVAVRCRKTDNYYIYAASC